jgi:hypothetical protein
MDSNGVEFDEMPGGGFVGLSRRRLERRNETAASETLLSESAPPKNRKNNPSIS